MQCADWQPAATLEVLRLRAQLLAAIRTFFAERGVWEADTPALSTAATTDPQLESFTTMYTGPGVQHTLYLHTSPEFPMKRLLAAGSGSIYQIVKAFRNGENGRWHNPEFMLLEWYRVGFDQQQLMDEVTELVILVLQNLDLKPPERLSYAAVFRRYLGLDPHTATVAELADCVTARGLHAPPGMPAEDPNLWLDFLWSHGIESQLGQGRLTFIYDYPVAQAALATIRPGNPPVAERFELYLNGIALANGFHELGDAAEQYRRCQHNNQVRAGRGLPVMPLDERLLIALESGLPDCAGVALGIDRLLMIAAGKSSLGEVLAFPLGRA